MIVCVCHSVSDRDIARVAAQGCNSFEDLQSALGVASRCGICRQQALDSLQSQASGCTRSCGGCACT